MSPPASSMASPSPDTEDATLPANLAPAEGVLRVMNKVDLGANGDSVAALAISATAGDGVGGLAGEIRRRIVRDEDLAFPGRWARLDPPPSSG